MGRKECVPLQGNKDTINITYTRFSLLVSLRISSVYNPRSLEISLYPRHHHHNRCHKDIL